MNLSNKIKQLRYKASLTQEELADKLGLSPQAVSKWENAAAMPDNTLLPFLAEIFGVSIDELFDLTAEQKLRRIENRMELEEELPPDVFREYEDILTEQLNSSPNKLKATSLLAQLYHHRMESDAKKAGAYAREAIQTAPEKKDCQWILQKAEGGTSWDWNIANHSRTIDFYKNVIACDPIEPKTPLPYYYLLDNLIADHRVAEAKAYLKQCAQLPAHRPFLIPVYEAAIALAEFNEGKADALIEKALADFPEETGVLFEAAQYYARKCDYDKAIHYYELSYASEEGIKPRFTDALEGIAIIHEIREDYQQAADTHQRILDSLVGEWGLTEETVIRHEQQQINRLLQKAAAQITQ